MPLWDLRASDFQRALKITMTISPGYLRHNDSDNAEKKMLIHNHTSLN